MTITCPTPVSRELQPARASKVQKTLKESVSVRGFGIFSGESAELRLCPAPANSGIRFQRVDLADKPIFIAACDRVHGTPRCTIVGDQQASVQTVEHLLAALKAYEIDNVLIEISGPEVPILDGSSLPFVDMIEKAGTTELDSKREIYGIQTPVFWSQGPIHLVALPSSEYRISYTLHYPHCSAIGSQFYSCAVEQEFFKKEIAPCRTFSIYEEIAPMIEKGLVKGGSLENAVLIRENKVANPEGLRFSDEMVRHKVLDLIGDLSLVPVPFVAHVIAIRSGHTSNNAFAKELFNHIKMENS